MAALDMKHTPENPLPQTWMQLDIGLGCLTMHMENRDWLKGLVDDSQSDVFAKISGENETPGRGSLVPNQRPMAAAAAQEEEKKEEVKEEEKKEDDDVIPKINMGKRAGIRLTGIYRRML